MLKDKMQEVVELLCEEREESRQLSKAFAVSLHPIVSVSDIYESYVIASYWYEICGIMRRGTESEDDEAPYKDAERLLWAATQALDKALMVSMHVNKNLRYET